MSAEHLRLNYLVVVMLLCNRLREAKVADLCIVLRDQQDVPGSEVSVHKVILLQVLHPHGDLMNQLCDVSYGRAPVDRAECDFTSYGG